MPHLAKFRTGWSNENLAQFILYKFAFTANPSKIADDIGLDYICTLIESQTVKRTTFLYPKSTFAIQIKSNSRAINITEKVGQFNNLELPFFIGVVNQEKLSLSIYSGEFLQLFFSHKGIDLKLKIKLTQREDSYGVDDYYRQNDDGSYILFFPYITEIYAHEKIEDIKDKVSLIQKVSTTILDNISSKRNHEYIFTVFGNRSPQLYMFAGPGSVMAFRKNVINRITEVF